MILKVDAHILVTSIAVFAKLFPRTLTVIGILDVFKRLYDFTLKQKLLCMPEITGKEY